MPVRHLTVIRRGRASLRSRIPVETRRPGFTKLASNPYAGWWSVACTRYSPAA